MSRRCNITVEKTAAGWKITRASGIQFLIDKNEEIFLKHTTTGRRREYLSARVLEITNINGTWYALLQAISHKNQHQRKPARMTRADSVTVRYNLRGIQETAKKTKEERNELLELPKTVRALVEMLSTLRMAVARIDRNVATVMHRLDLDANGSPPNSTYQPGYPETKSDQEESTS